MKKPFSLNPRRFGRRSAVLKGIPVATATVTVLILVFVLVRTLAPGVFYTLTSPLWSVGTNTAGFLYGVQSSFADTRELTAERDRLAAQLAELSEANSVLTTKVADLEKLVGTRNEGEKHILAGVLARPPESLYDTLVVDAGSKEGIAVGAVAYGPGGAPLGTVEQVTDHTAHLRLYTSSGRETSGWIGDTHLPVTLTGQGGGVFSATVPRGTGIAVGTLVSLPGPGALPIGHVLRIDSDPSSPRDTLHIQTSTNFFSLTWVEIAAHASL